MERLENIGRNSSPFSHPASEVNLSGRTVLAFGGAGALAEPFLYRAAASGARVAIAEWASPRERLEKVARNVADVGPEEPLVMLADVCSPEDVRAVCAAIVAETGGIDVAVDFAGRHHSSFDLVGDDVDKMVDTFRSVIELNLTGAFVFTAVVSQAMIRRRSGHIIHLCSSGSRASLYGSYAYNASKHGVEGLVKTAAAQLAPYGVRVNGIAPGTVITDLNRHLSFTEEGEPKPRARSILAHTPTKRFATADGVAETLLSMCVQQRHLTGNVIFPDDGYVIEGHSWPEGNVALYESAEALDALYAEIDEKYPRP